MNTISSDLKHTDGRSYVINEDGKLSYIVQRYDKMTAEQREEISTKYDFVENY